MKQLVAPNLSAVGRIGYCLEYMARVYGTTQVAPYAWVAWQQTQFKHTGPIPTDVSVPCWFSYYVNGINEGHVVASVPGKGFYSSPWKQGTTHAVLTSIAEVERIYGVKYVGWSEDILSKRIVEGGNMATITTEMVVALSLGTQGTQPQNADQTKWIGKTDQGSFDGMVTQYSALGRAYQASLGQKPTDAQIDHWISLFYQEAYGKAATDAIFNSWRPVLKNNFVEGSLSIMIGTDTNAEALKNQPTGGFELITTPVYKKK